MATIMSTIHTGDPYPNGPYGFTNPNLGLKKPKYFISLVPNYPFHDTNNPPHTVNVKYNTISGLKNHQNSQKQSVINNQKLDNQNKLPQEEKRDPDIPIYKGNVTQKMKLFSQIGPGSVSEETPSNTNTNTNTRPLNSYQPHMSGPLPSQNQTHPRFLKNNNNNSYNQDISLQTHPQSAPPVGHLGNGDQNQVNQTPNPTTQSQTTIRDNQNKNNNHNNHDNNNTNTKISIIRRTPQNSGTTLNSNIITLKTDRPDQNINNIHNMQTTITTPTQVKNSKTHVNVVQRKSNGGTVFVLTGGSQQSQSGQQDQPGQNMTNKDGEKDNEMNGNLDKAGKDDQLDAELSYSNIVFGNHSLRKFEKSGNQEVSIFYRFYLGFE